MCDRELRLLYTDTIDFYLFLTSTKKEKKIKSMYYRKLNMSHSKYVTLEKKKIYNL